ncbi:hypothetical protein SAMN05877838_3101 [Hoeflea halophila]|uniref:Flagellar assembly protein FliH n=1 Tax=Hoeflea halophila TaxID=714899 RepID=A0A286IDG7_9HYPH|nr:hypothetical protein [Hoeflea halophila]SOE18183.1 hypothetical protein SAMN05877838_3101 [Hoeflea halophila]
MTASFARYLPDFEFTNMNGFHAGQHVVEDEKPAALPNIDIESIRAEARAEGDAIARAELTRKFEAEHLAIENLHAAEMQALREELEISAAKTIPAAIEARSAEIAEVLAADVEAVLTPLIDEAVRKRILAGLAEEVRRALALDNAGQIRISGPEALADTLCEQLGAGADGLTVEKTEDFDIEIEIDRTLFASRLVDWSKALAEVL